MKKITDSKHRIIEILEMYNMTQAEFCEKTKIGKSALSNYLNTDRQPRQDAIALICEPFGINPAWLMGYDIDMYLTSDIDKKLMDTYRSLNQGFRVRLVDYAQGLLDAQMEQDKKDSTSSKEA